MILSRLAAMSVVWRHIAGRGHKQDVMMVGLGICVLSFATFIQDSLDIVALVRVLLRVCVWNRHISVRFN